MTESFDIEDESEEAFRRRYNALVKLAQAQAEAIADMAEVDASIACKIDAGAFGSEEYQAMAYKKTLLIRSVQRHYFEVFGGAPGLPN